MLVFYAIIKILGADYMEITNQEKINISYLFISAYENIVNLIKPIHNLLSNMIKGSNESESELIVSMYNRFIEIYGKNKILKIKNTHRLLVDVGVFSEQDLSVLIKLSKIRNDIGHESLQIYFNNVSYEYFCLEELLGLYKKLFNKIKELIIDKKINDLITFYEIQTNSYSSLSMMLKSVFFDPKFKNLENIL